jgi:heptaprenyl diphosphate synthase
LLLSLLMGRKIRPLPMIALILGTALCNLAVPYGKVLARLGPLLVTGGSLITGLRKGITMEGLIILSKTAIGGDLRLPGRPGRLLGESLRFLGRLGEGKGGIARRGFIQGIDELLIKTEQEGPPEEAERPTGEGPETGRLRGRLILVAAVLAAAALGAAGELVPPLPGDQGGF